MAALSVASAIERVKTFMKSLVDIEGKKVIIDERTFCLVIHGITQEYFNVLFPDAPDTSAASCPPPLELGADINWKIYLFVHERLKDNYDDILDTVLEAIKELNYEDVMFENAASNNSNNNNNANNANDSGYNAGNENGGNYYNNSTSTTAVNANNYESVYGWQGENNSASVNSTKSFRTAKGSTRRRRMGKRRSKRRI